MGVGEMKATSLLSTVCIVVTLVLVPICKVNAQFLFYARVDYEAGLEPWSVAVGDFDGDGNQDLAVANSGSDTVSILLGNGDRSFQEAVDYGAGDYPNSVDVGDFNEDGHQDLAVANNASDDVSILINLTGSQCWDSDGDGYEDVTCGGDDCDDTNPNVNPGADEICDNGLDDDCDRLGDAWDTDCCDDADGDHFTDEACGGADCDDTEPLTSPGMQEIQGDGIDNDCDGQIDEACFIGTVM